MSGDQGDRRERLDKVEQEAEEERGGNNKIRAIIPPQ